MPLYGSDDIVDAYVIGNYELAEQLSRKRVDAAERTYGPQQLETANELFRLAQILDAKGNKSESEKLRRRISKIVQNHYS